MNTSIDVRILGPIEVHVDGHAVDLGGPQPRAVIAHLALDLGRVVPVDRLVNRLWGDHPPASPLGSLHSTFSRLRRLIEPARGSGTPPTVIVSEAPGYVLRLAEEAVDLTRFRALARAGRTSASTAHHAQALTDLDAALAVWRGSALAGIGPDSVVAPIALALDEERLSVIEDRFDTVLALGRHADAVADLSVAVAEHPLRERLWSTLAIALYRSQRQADALRAIEQARRTLIDELGLDPGPDLRRLEQRILDHDPSLLAVPLVATPAPLTPSTPTPVDRSLVGRDAEWSRLVEALTAAGSGSPSMLLLEGEPGIGKSVLAERFLAHAAGLGWRVAVGRCVDGGLAPALWPIVEVMRALDDPAAAGALAPDDVRVRTPIEIADIAAAALDTAAGDHGWCVFVDDLHWGDRLTLDVLTMLSERLRDRRALLIGATRPVGSVPDSVLPDVIGRLGRHVERIGVSPLAEHDVAVLLRHASGSAPSDEAVRVVTERAGGNPLFVAELGRLFGESGVIAGDAVPDAVRDLVHARLAPLPPETASVLEVAAIAGERFDVPVVVAASGLDADACLDALDPAIVIRVLVPGRGGELRFAHALVRDAVLSEVGALRRARLHHTIADAIERIRGTGVDAIEPIARHRLAALAVGDPTRTAAQLVEAAHVARWRGALDTSDEFAGAAIEVVAGTARDAALDTIEGRALEALVLADSNRVDHPSNPSRMADSIEALAVRSGSDAARALALYARWWSVDVDPVATKAHVAAAELALAERTDNRYAQVLGYYVAGTQAMLEGRLTDASRLCEAAITATGVSDPAQAPEVAPNVQLPSTAAMSALLVGDERRGRRHVDRDEVWKRSRGRLDRSAAIDIAYTRGFFAAVQDDAVATRRAIETLDTTGAPVWTAHLANGCAVWEGWSAVLLGDAGGADRALAALDRVDATRFGVLVPCWRTFTGAALLAAGDARCVGVLAEAHDESLTHGEVFWLAETLRLRALAEHRFGDAELAPHLLDDARRTAERQGVTLLAERLAADL